MRITFTSCEYEGKLVDSTGNTNPDVNRIDFIEYARQHLQKSYADIHNAPNKIENKCRDYHNQLRELMTAEYKPSFQREIIRRLTELCPKLTRVRSISEGHNWYFEPNIFKMIFEQIRDGTTQSFAERQYGDVWELSYEGSFLLMRGEKSEISGLKTAITSLIGDNEIREFVTRFQQLKAEMVHETTTFLNMIQMLRTAIDTGEILNTPGDCNLAICRANCR
jgi:hypothetical protein